MATTSPSTHSRTSSTCTASSRSSSPAFRLLPRSSDSSYVRHSALPYRPHQEPQPSQPSQSSHHFSHASYPTRSRRSQGPNTASPRTSRPTSTSHLSTSIERVTLPMLAHLNQELNLTHLEAERDRVRRQIQRQETVLTLSMLLKVWGDDGAGAGESSRWSDDSDEEEAGDLLDY